MRALVKWWGGTMTRPYLWKENASDTTYRESWDYPREPRLSQSPKQQEPPRRFIAPKKIAQPEPVTEEQPIAILCRKAFPFHPSAKIRLANIGYKAVRNVPRGRPCIRHRQVRSW